MHTNNCTHKCEYAKEKESSLAVLHRFWGHAKLMVIYVESDYRQQNEWVIG